jgi:hypothetical protein
MTGKDIEIYKNFSFGRSPKIYMPDKVLSYKLIPSVSRNVFTSEFQLVYTTNSLGLREKEIEDSPKFKILFLGDSMTFGEGVPDGRRFSDLIEQELGNVYSINAGVPGYGIHQMYLWLQYYGLRLRPDLVICVIISVDLERAVYKGLKDSPHILIQKQKVRKCSEGMGKYLVNYLRKTLGRLLQKSYFYSFAKVRIKILLIRSKLKERDKKVWDKIRQKIYDRNKVTANAKRGLVKKESFQIFLDFKNLLEDKHINFLVVNISPTAIPWLEDFFRKQNIEYLDLAPQLKKVSNIAFEIDPHYNTAGHRTIANLLRDYIRSRYLRDK